jgi:hypothetical protein
VRTVTFAGNTTYTAQRLEGLMLTRPSRFLATSRFHPGVVGLALGSGSQHLVQDVISGLFILLDDEIRVGDYVSRSG